MTKKIILTSFFAFLANFLFAQTEIKITEDSLPKAIHDEFHKKYSSYKVNSIAKKSDKGLVSYTLELQKKTTLLRLSYGADGKLLDKEKSKIYMYDGTEPVKKSKPIHSNDGHNHQH